MGVNLVVFDTIFQETSFCVKVRLLSTKGVTTIQHLPPKSVFLKKKDENMGQFQKYWHFSVNFDFSCAVNQFYGIRIDFSMKKV